MPSPNDGQVGRGLIQLGWIAEIGADLIGGIERLAQAEARRSMVRLPVLSKFVRAG